MKNKILFSAMFCIACTFSIHVNAQLQVNSNGQTKVTKQLAVNGANITDSVALNVNAAITSGSKKYGVYSYREVQNPIPISERGANICILGQVRPLTHSGGQVMNFPSLPALNPLFVGVAGLASTGVGVYGATGSYIPSTWTNGNYAGYFNGTVNVNGSLIATTLSTTSDYNKKENIKKIELELAGKINQLQPISYTFKQDSIWKYDKEAKELQGVHYGLIAQEVQKVFPELVYERGGQLSINYIELIPLLILEVQKLSAEVEVLQKRIDGK